MSRADDFIEQAALYIGHYGDYNCFNRWYWCIINGYDEDPGWAWCAVFQSYVADDLGLDFRYSASSAAFGTQFPRVWEPQRGDFVLFNWDGRTDTSWTDHIGVVEWVDNDSGYFGTIEGNTGYGDVSRCTRYQYAGYFCAFFRPDWEGEEPHDEPVPEDEIHYIASSDPEGIEWYDLMIGHHDTGGSGDTFAGEMGKPIRWFAVEGVGRYRVSTTESGWLPWVDEFDISDLDYGCAGDGSEITAIEIPNANVVYQVHILGGRWLAEMIGNYDTGGSSDKFAGAFVPIDAVRIKKKV